MKNEMIKTKYVYILDTSSIIDLFRLYPLDIFSKLWENIDDLIKKERVISHEYVLKELSKRDDEIYKWAKSRKNVFVGITKDQVEIIKRLSEEIEEFRKLVEEGKDKDIHADPWLIALSIEKEQQRKILEVKVKTIIITEERFRQNKVNIPFVCQKLNIEYTNIIGLMRKENWKF